MIMDDYSRVPACGPLAPYVDGLRAEFTALGYASSTVGAHLALWAQLSRWLQDQGLDAARLTAARIEEFVAVRRHTHRYPHTVNALTPGLGFLRRAGVIPGIQARVADTALEAIECQFRTYLLVVRGLAEVSADTYVSRARPFLAERARRGPPDLELPIAADVSSSCRTLVARFVEGTGAVDGDGATVLAVVPACHRSSR